MENYYIADQFSLLSKLMDIHGENSFKSKSYSITAYNIEQLPVKLAETPTHKIFASAQKGGLTKENNLSSFSLEKFTRYLSVVKRDQCLKFIKR